MTALAIADRAVRPPRRVIRRPLAFMRPVVAPNGRHVWACHAPDGVVAFHAFTFDAAADFLRAIAH